MYINDFKTIENYSERFLKMLLYVMNNPLRMQRSTNLKIYNHKGYHYRCGEYDNGIPLNGKLRFNVTDPSRGMEVIDTSNQFSTGTYVSRTLFRMGKRVHKEESTILIDSKTDKIMYIQYKKNGKVLHVKHDYGSNITNEVIDLPNALSTDFESHMFQIETTSKYAPIVRFLSMISRASYKDSNGRKKRFDDMFINPDSDIDSLIKMYESETPEYTDGI